MSTILERLDAMAPQSRDVVVVCADHRIWLHGPATTRPEALVSAIRLLLDLCGLPEGWRVVVEPVKRED